MSESSSAAPAATRWRAKRALDLVLLALLTLLPAALVMSPAFFRIQADEYHSAWPAQRLLAGDRLYVDVFTHRPPLDIWLNAAAQAALGPRLFASRALQLLALLALSLTSWALLRRAGARRGLAFGGALLPSWLCFPLWPLPSAHWLALPFATGALLSLEWGLAGSGRRLAQGCALAGVLVSASGLVIQTEGVVALGWVGAALLAGAARQDRPRALGWLALGGATVVGGVTTILAAQGSLRGACEAVISFPLTRYRAPGGFNDVSLGATAAEDLASAAAAGRWALVACQGAVLVLFALAALATAWCVLARRRAVDLARVAVVALALLVFSRARTDLIHLANFLPFALLAGALAALDPRAPRGVRLSVGGAWGAALVAAGALWIGTALRGVDPSSWTLASDPIQARAEAVERGLPPELQGQPLLALPYGATFYFYRQAETPALDWICLPSSRYNSPEQFERVAAWLSERQIPLVLVNRGPRGEGFLHEPSPLREALRRDYRLTGQVEDQWVYVRRSGPDPR